MLQRAPWRDHRTLRTHIIGPPCRKHCGLGVTARAAAQSNAHPMKIAVVGGGICGPVMATLLARELQAVLPRPLEVHLFDKRSKEDTAGGSITLAPNGMRVLQRLGLVDSLVDTQGDAAAEEATAAAAAAGLSAVQGSGVGVGSRSGTGWGAEPPAGEELKSITLANPDGSAIVTFPTRTAQQQGVPYVGFRRFRLRRVLLEAAERQQGVTVHYGKELERVLDCGEFESGAGSTSNITQQRHTPTTSTSAPSGPTPLPTTTTTTTTTSRPATLFFSDGSSFAADLVVGCDGIRSAVRAAVRGTDEPSPRYTGSEEVIVVTRDRCADLVPPGAFTLVLGSGGRQFGTYGVGPDCMWFASRQRPESRDAWGAVTSSEEQQAVRQELLEAFRGWPLVEQLVQREAAVMIRVGIYDRDPVSCWHRGAVVLAGDAAAPIPPNLGQGGNKALEDAGVLVACLRRFRGDLPRAFALYERLRVPRAALLLGNTRGGSGITLADHPVVVWLRNVLIRAVVGLTGSTPLSYLWAYDTEAEVERAAGKGP